MRQRLLLYTLLVLLLNVVLASSLAAQGVTGNLADRVVGDASRSPVDQQIIEEIIVTSTRREANVQSVPLSVHVLTDEDIERLGATGYADYARTVPGVSFTDIGLGGEKQVIRGISTVANLPEVNPTTSLYLDEVPVMGGGVGVHYHANPMLVDIERIEVLRGPQGTLFGASSMGGAIRIITEQPDISEREGFLSAVVSSYDGGGDGYELRGMYNVPLNDGRAAIRAVGYYRDMDGFIDNLTTGINNVNTDDIVGARLSGTVLLSDNVSITGRIAYQDSESAGNSIEEIEDGPRLHSRLPESNGDEWVNYNLVVNVDSKWATLLSSTSYLDRSLSLTLDISPFIDAVFGFSNPFWTNIADDSREFVQEFRLISDEEDQLSWVAGAYYQHLSQDFFQDFPAPGFDAQTDNAAANAGVPDNLAISHYNNTLEQLGLYGEATYAITDQIDMIAGARWFDISQDTSNTTIGLFLAGAPLESGIANESGVTPKIGLSFTYSEDLTLYATAAEGFRAGGNNTGEGSDSPECIAELASIGYSEYPSSYDSDSLWSYELGAKTRWLDGRASLNAAVYHIDWSDMRTQRFLDCGITFRPKTRATRQSMESSWNLSPSPTDSFDIILAASYTDATC